MTALTKSKIIDLVLHAVVVGFPLLLAGAMAWQSSKDDIKNLQADKLDVRRFEQDSINSVNRDTLILRKIDGMQAILCYDSPRAPGCHR